MLRNGSFPICQEHCVVVLHVDDAIVFSKGNTEIERALQQFDHLNHNFQCNKTFSLHLGIQLQNLANGRIKLLQQHIKPSTINIMGLSKTNLCMNLISSPLFKHMHSLPFKHKNNCPEDWEQHSSSVFSCNECMCASLHESSSSSG